MISFFLITGLALMAIVLATIVLTLSWERDRVARQAQQQGIWVRNSVNLG
jgi:hypothetical protein